MSVSFYMDEHVPGAVTEGLRLRGIDVLTAQEDGLGGWDDSALIERATELGRVLVTQDADLLREAAALQRRGVRFSGVIYTHQGALTIRQFIEELELFGIAGNENDVNSLALYLPL